LAIFEQLEVNRKHRKFTEHDNGLAYMENNGQSLCLMSQRPSFWIKQIM